MWVFDFSNVFQVIFLDYILMIKSWQPSMLVHILFTSNRQNIKRILKTQEIFILVGEIWKGKCRREAYTDVAAKVLRGHSFDDTLQ